jgi:peroxiredoxin
MRYKHFLFMCLMGAASGAVSAAAADLTPTAVTVLARENVLVVDRAMMSGDELLVPTDSVIAITGFQLKPQGLCAGEVCIAMPSDESWIVEQGEKKYFNVSRFARRVNQVYAVDPEAKVWSFTAVPRPETSPLLAGQAPDFALEDRDGKLVRLSDFRGKKVLILTWASWCGCRFDLAGWQKVYEDLKDKNFEIVAAAEDTGGAKISTPWYDKAKVTYTALVDPTHTVSSLYQMVNVPTGVWVDETGKIVRAGEVAYSKQQHVLGQAIGDDRYAQGLRDWVERGEQSEYAIPAEQLKSRIKIRSENERLADAYFKLGAYFSTHGQSDLAAKHWRKSQEMNPDNWNYHRQEWSYDKKKEMSNWMAKVRKLGTKPYYDPVEFPESKNVPAAPPAKP